MNTEELIYKMYQSRYFKIGDVEFSWLDHEEAWFISYKYNHVYGYMDNPYSIVLFKLIYCKNMIEEITEEIPLNRISEDKLINIIIKMNDNSY